MAIKNIDLLEKLDYNKQLTFAYLTCERLYPNYVYFSNNFDFGEKNALKKAINFIYDNLLISEFVNEEEIRAYITSIDINTPFPHNFETELASSALDACTSIEESLMFMIDKKVTRLNSISIFATDTVDMYIAVRDARDFNSDKQFEQKLLSDRLMQKELSIQNGIVDYLVKIDTIELFDVQNLLALQYNNQKGNLDLS